MGKLEYSDLKIEALASDAAFVRGSWKLPMPEGKMRHRLIIVFRRFPEGWKIVHDHTSLEE
jgi:beta-aspartyl-peptidase (threonine type)